MKIYLLLVLLALTTRSAAAEPESIRRGIVKSGFAMALNLIQARSEGLVCDFDAYQDRITILIDGVISLATNEEIESFKVNIPKNSDLWSNFMFKVILDKNQWNLDGVKIRNYLQNSKFWGASSAIGPRHLVEFSGDGKVKVSHLELPEDGKPFWVSEETDWELIYNSASDTKLRIGTKIYIFEKTYQEIILVPAKNPDEKNGTDVLRGSPMECDA